MISKTRQDIAADRHARYAKEISLILDPTLEKYWDYTLPTLNKHKGRETNPEKKRILELIYRIKHFTSKKYA